MKNAKTTEILIKVLKNKYYTLSISQLEEAKALLEDYMRIALLLAESTDVRPVRRRQFNALYWELYSLSGQLVDEKDKRLGYFELMNRHRLYEEEARHGEI